jgi:hypothetical protein
MGRMAKWQRIRNLNITGKPKGTVKLAESRLGGSRAGWVNGRDDDGIIAKTSAKTSCDQKVQDQSHPE